MASRNKLIGRKAEHKFVSWFADRFGLIKLVKSKSGANLHEAEIARAEDISQQLDNQGIDIWFSPRVELAELNVQIKSTLATGKKVKTIDIEPLMSMPEEGINVLITEVKHRPNKNMMHYADVVTISLEDFAKIMTVYTKNKDE